MSMVGKDQLYHSRVRIGGGRFSNIYRCVGPSDAICALKIVDTDDYNVPPHSITVELSILKYLKSVLNHCDHASNNNNNNNVALLIDEYKKYDDQILVLPYYQFTLLDYVRKNSRMRTNFTALLSTDNQEAPLDPIDEYFYTDDDYGQASAVAPRYQRINKLDIRKAMNIIKQILQGLNFIHDNGIIHRDIKPENILISVDDDDEDEVQVAITDFGISYMDKHQIKRQESLVELCKELDFTRSAEPDAGHKFTQISSGVFKPPEVVLGITDYGTELDIWSLGIIVSQLLSKDCLPVLNKSGNFSDIALLQSIFQTFGTPDEHCWPRVQEIDIFRNFNFTKYEKKEIDEVLPKLQGEEGFSWFEKVFNQMMEYDANKRITAEKALEEFTRSGF
ncbi:cyclin-dependent protein kinase-activating kinase [Saccharomycopsis crataegensis]|uniref:Cyclin-dependent protein kinase-activating kinase n=1 Tax=Saccharomycopsis crataegensis TaxID=43959 RepID=A0AAV5QRC0_9ASCO|nr:cyclin-dependent protein kinase-activating kinase [Saccharomycopsis crataegensis]